MADHESAAFFRPHKCPNKMSTAMAVRQQEKMGYWPFMFCNEQITQQQSALFVKRLLAIAISNITYLRAMFPEQAFGDRSIEELNLKILRDDSSCPGACQVIKWMKGCFDAIDKKYLEQLIIGIYTDCNNLNSIIESYTFKFLYMQDGIDIYRNDKKISGACTATETKKATIQLLRTIIVLNQTLKPLPDNVWLTVKLYYHDEVTPADYEPPGFKAADPEDFQFANEALNIKVGNVPTPFHMIKLRIKTDKKQFEENDLKTLEKDQIPHETKSEPSECEDDMTTVAVPEKKCEVAVLKKKCEVAVPEKKCEVAVLEKESDFSTANKTVSKETAKKPPEDEDAVSCPCNFNEDDGLMIICANCKYWQHAVCFGLLDEDGVPSTHYCAACSKLIDKACTDPSLVKLVSTHQQANCLWRRVLFACLEENHCTVQGLCKRLGVQNTVALGFFNRLKREGFIKKSTLKRNAKNVDVKKLRSVGIPQYFLQTDSEMTKENSVCEQMETCSPDDEAEEQVNKLAKQANSLSLLNETGPKFEEFNHENDATSSSVNPNRITRSRKRAIASTDYSKCNDFELSNSQDDGLKRRKKSSLATMSIPV